MTTAALDDLPLPGLLPLEAAVASRACLRESGRRLVVTNGCFDLLHPGHIRFLQEARALGDRLWVLVNSDASVRALKGPTRPVIPERARAFCLLALNSVDAVIVFDTLRLDAQLAALAPDHYAKAGDYTLETIDTGERSALQAAGAQIHFLPLLEGFSTTGLIARINAAARADTAGSQTGSAAV